MPFHIDYTTLLTSLWKWYPCENKQNEKQKMAQWHIGLYFAESRLRISQIPLPLYNKYALGGFDDCGVKQTCFYQCPSQGKSHSWFGHSQR